MAYASSVEIVTAQSTLELNTIMLLLKVTPEPDIGLVPKVSGNHAAHQALIVGPLERECKHQLACHAMSPFKLNQHYTYIIQPLQQYIVCHQI